MFELKSGSEFASLKQRFHLTLFRRSNEMKKEKPFSEESLKCRQNKSL